MAAANAKAPAVRMAVAERVTPTTDSDDGLTKPPNRTVAGSYSSTRIRRDKLRQVADLVRLRGESDSVGMYPRVRRHAGNVPPLSGRPPRGCCLVRAVGAPSHDLGRRHDGRLSRHELCGVSSTRSGRPSRGGLSSGSTSGKLGVWQCQALANHLTCYRNCHVRIDWFAGEARSGCEGRGPILRCRRPRLWFEIRGLRDCGGG